MNKTLHDIMNVTGMLITNSKVLFKDSVDIAAKYADYGVRWQMQQKRLVQL